jgi:hypothetical protein
VCGERDGADTFDHGGMLHDMCYSFGRHAGLGRKNLSALRADTRRPLRSSLFYCVVIFSIGLETNAPQCATTFSDLIGKLDVLRVTCDKCGRHRGHAGQFAKRLPPRQGSPEAYRPAALTNSSRLESTALMQPARSSE